MIKILENAAELKKEIAQLGKEVAIDEILRIDLPFIESQPLFTVLNIPSYGQDRAHNILFVAQDKTFVVSGVTTIKIEKKFEKFLKKKHGETTIGIFILLKAILKNYSHEFWSIRDRMNALDLDPQLDSIEETGRDLRKLTDRLEGLLQIIMELIEEEIDCFNPQLIKFEYDLLMTETRYWLERCRSHNYRIASLRTKSEMKSNRELNDTMKKLTTIMTFLTIVSIVVSVPGTVGAIFGIPALSDAYFKSHTQILIITLIATTILSLVLGFFYWRSLNLKQR